MIKRVTIEEDYKNLMHYLTDEEPVTLICVYQGTHVNYGIEEDCDVRWCEENNIPVHNLQRSAGCIVQADGSIGLFDVRPSSDGWVEHQILPDFRDYLISKGLNVELIHNDILVDGYKVASAGGMNLAPDYKWQYTCMHIAVYQDVETIRHACLKPMTKEPKALSEWGITTEEMVEWCENWFNGFRGENNEE